MYQPDKALELDCAAEVDRLSSFLQRYKDEMKFEGAVVGLSGGIDSALSSAICVRTFGKDRVLGVLLPEKESSPDSARLARYHAKQSGISTQTIDITPTLESCGVYQKREEAIRQLFPEYTSECLWKMVLPPDILGKDTFNYSLLKILPPKSSELSIRLNASTMRQLVAATNTKQRTRMIYLYQAAEARNYFVCGTTNKSELTQGFFVKYGDGGVDIEPLAHLYKTQVFALARYLGVPDQIISRTPTPDTYSFPASDEEMFFRMPYATLDKLLYAWENSVDIEEVSDAMSLTVEQVSRAFRDFDSKNRATKNIRLCPPMIKS